MREIERRVLLSVIDEKWRDHLHEIDILKEGIYLRAYAQKDPLLEYKGEGFRAFEEMMGTIESETVRLLFRVVPMQAPMPAAHPRGNGDRAARWGHMPAPATILPVRGAGCPAAALSRRSRARSTRRFRRSGSSNLRPPGAPRPAKREAPRSVRRPLPCGAAGNLEVLRSSSWRQLGAWPR
jgi:preprotein translocase subunit SecA